MNEALILEKLDILAKEVQTLKTEIRGQQSSDTNKVNQQHSPNNLEELTSCVKDIQSAVEGMKKNHESLKPGIELMSGTRDYLEEIDGQPSADDLKEMFSRMLTSLYAINKSLNTVDGDKFQAKELEDFFYTMQINFRTFNDLMNIVSPMTEFIKEFEAIMKQTNVISSINSYLDTIQQGNGALKLTTMVLGGFRNIDLTDEQVEHIRKTLSEINLNDVEPMGPVAMIKQLKDPNFQKTMGVLFMIMQAIGSCIQVCTAGKTVAQKK